MSPLDYFCIRPDGLPDKSADWYAKQSPIDQGACASRQGLNDRLAEFFMGHAEGNHCPRAALHAAYPLPLFRPDFSLVRGLHDRCASITDYRPDDVACVVDAHLRYFSYSGCNAKCDLSHMSKVVNRRDICYAISRAQGLRLQEESRKVGRDSSSLPRLMGTC